MKLLILLLPACLVEAGSTFEFKVAESLYGKFRQGDSTEIRVDIASPRASSAELIIDDWNGETIYHLQLDEQQKKTLWLGVTPKQNGTLTATLTPGQSESIAESMSFSPLDSLIVLVSINPKENDWDDNVSKQTDPSTVLLTTANGFPHTIQGYMAVGSIVTDLQTLTKLDEQQSKALGAHLAACGILLLDDAAPRVLEGLAAQAGCGGRFVKGFASLNEVPSLQQQLAAQLPAKLPDIEELIQLTPAPGHLWIVFYLATYLLLMALLTAISSRPVLLLLLPLLTAGAGIIAWYGKGQQYLIIWAETEGGDTHARYSALLSTGGDRRGLQTSIFSQDANLRRNHHSAIGQPIRHDVHDGTRQLSNPTTLFSPEIVQLEGLIRNTDGFGVNLSMIDDRPRVSNQSHESSPPGYLVWHNRSFQIPPLPPEEAWRPETSGNPPEDPAIQLLSRRTPYGEAALLYPMPMDSSHIAPSATRSSGWLIIHPAPETRG